MKPHKELYLRFVNTIGRLTKIDHQLFIEKYVYEELEPSDYLKIAGNTIPRFTDKLLIQEPVLIQTVIILTLMEAADNKKEFEQLHKKRKKRIADPTEKKKDLEGFDKILKGIMQVSKPKNKIEKEP